MWRIHWRDVYYGDYFNNDVTQWRSDDVKWWAAEMMWYYIGR